MCIRDSPDRALEQRQTLTLLQESLDELPENMRDIPVSYTHLPF